MLEKETGHHAAMMYGPQMLYSGALKLYVTSLGVSTHRQQLDALSQLSDALINLRQGTPPRRLPKCVQGLRAPGQSSQPFGQTPRCPSGQSAPGQWTSAEQVEAQLRSLWQQVSGVPVEENVRVMLFAEASGEMHVNHTLRSLFYALYGASNPHAPSAVFIGGVPNSILVKTPGEQTFSRYFLCFLHPPSPTARISVKGFTLLNTMQEVIVLYSSMLHHQTCCESIKTIP